MPKKLPAPFRRDSIDLDRAHREWTKDVDPRKLQLGDVVADKGKVRRVVLHIDWTEVHYEQRTTTYELGDTVFAFTST